MEASRRGPLAESQCDFREPDSGLPSVKDGAATEVAE